MGIGDHFQSPMKGATRSTPSTYSVPHLASYLSPSLALLQSPDASALLPASILLSQGLCVRCSSCFRSSSPTESLGLFSHFIQVSAQMSLREAGPDYLSSR